MPKRTSAFYAAAKAAPKTDLISVTSLMLDRFRETLAENITVMVTVYVVLSGIIAIGVVYNFSRIALSEQGRELASLRVLGFTNREVSGVLFANWPPWSCWRSPWAGSSATALPLPWSRPFPRTFTACPS
jgi:hypothetical protein